MSSISVKLSMILKLYVGFRLPTKLGERRTTHSTLVKVQINAAVRVLPAKVEHLWFMII